MKKLRRQLQELKEAHPLLLCLIIIIIFVLLIETSGLVKFLALPINTIFIIEESLRVIAVVVLVYFLNEQRLFSNHEVKFFKGLTVGAFDLFITLLGLAAFFSENFQEAPFQSIIVFIFFSFLIGICEETCFRGLVTKLLAERYIRDRKSLYLTVLISGTIFGFLHIINVIGGASLSGVVVQMICATAAGCYFSTIYLRTGNIWVVIFLHAIEDFLAFNREGVVRGAETIVSSTSKYSVLQIAGVVLYLIPTLLLLRKSKSVKIIQRYSQLSIRTGNPSMIRNPKEIEY